MKVFETLLLYSISWRWQHLKHLSFSTSAKNLVPCYSFLGGTNPSIQEAQLMPTSATDLHYPSCVLPKCTWAHGVFTYISVSMRNSAWNISKRNHTSSWTIFTEREQNIKSGYAGTYISLTVIKKLCFWFTTLCYSCNTMQGCLLIEDLSNQIKNTHKYTTWEQTLKNVLKQVQAKSTVPALIWWTNKASIL